MVPVVSSLLFLMCLLLRQTFAKTDQSRVSIVHQKSIEDIECNLSDRLVQSDILCSRLCLQNTRCLLAHYHPGSKRCTLYNSNRLVFNPTEEGTILIIESRQNVDYCGGTCVSDVLVFPSIGSLYCKNNKHGGRWTVFQRRFDGSEDFYRDWANYKYGFGKMNGEFWLGLEKLHKLTSAGSYMLRVDLKDWDNNKRYSVYSSFTVGNESTSYRLKIDGNGYSGDAGNSLIRGTYLEANFSTVDRDNDNWGRECAVSNSGAWWYLFCSDSNLNGLYYSGGYSYYEDGMFWKSWNGYSYSFKATEMMIRRLD